MHNRLTTEEKAYFTLTKDEQAFIQQIFNFNSVVDIDPNIVTQLDDIASLYVIKDVKKTTFKINQYVQNAWLRTQTIMSFIKNPQLRSDFAIFENILITQNLKLLFENLDRKVSPHFNDACEEILSLSLLASFNPDAARYIGHHRYLVSLYRDKRNGLQMRNYIFGFGKFYLREFQRFIAFKDDTTKIITQKVERDINNFFQHLYDRYIETSQVQNARHPIAMTISVPTFLLSRYFASAEGHQLLVLFLMCLAFGYAIDCAGRHGIKRELNPSEAQRYINLITHYNNKLNFYSPSEMTNIIKKPAKEVLDHSLFLAKTTFDNLFTEPFSLEVKKQQPLFKIKYATESKNEETMPLYTYVDAMNLYKHSKLTKTKKTKQHNQTEDKTTAIPFQSSSTHQVSCELSESQKQKGLLFVNDSGSKAFVCFEQYADKIKGVYTSQSTNTFKYPDHVVPAFLSKKGEFNGIKFFEAHKCEFKFSNNERIYFDEDGTEPIKNKRR